MTQSGTWGVASRQTLYCFCCTCCQALPTTNGPESSASADRRRQDTFRRCEVRLQSRLFAPSNPPLRRSPNSHPAAEIVSDDLPTRQSICQAALNRGFGNTRDASVHADGAKSRFPKRVACALRGRNSSRVAIQVWRGAWRRYCLRERTAHPTQKEETGETASLTSPSRLPQIHRRHSAHTEQTAETAALTSPSQFLPQFHFVARPNGGRVYKERPVSKNPLPARWRGLGPQPCVQGISIDAEIQAA